MSYHPHDTRGPIKRKLSELSEAAGEWLIGRYFRLILLVLRQRGRYFLKLTSKCHAACLVECWTSVSGGKPIDFDSDQHREIDNAVKYYLNKAVYARGEFGFVEKHILWDRHASWFLRDKEMPDARSAQSLVDAHDLHSITDNYTNLNNFVGYLAARDAGPFENQFKESHCADYWRDTVNFGKLPEGFGASTKTRAVAKYLRQNLRAKQRALAERNYRKLDFGLSDITALVGLIGALLLFLGFVRILMLSMYYGFPPSIYFGVADYLSTGLALTGQTLIGSVLALFFSFIQLSTVNTYSLQQQDLRNKSTPERLERWAVHAVGSLSVLAVVTLYFFQGRADGLSVMFASMYVGSFLWARFFNIYFADALKAHLSFGIVFLSLSIVVGNVVIEINKLNHPDEAAKNQIVRFEDVEYRGRDWQFIAFTSEYVVMRNRESGTLLARRRSDLKSIQTQ